MRWMCTTALLVAFCAAVSFAGTPELPDYKNWPTSFPTTINVKLNTEDMDVVVEAAITMYFNAAKMEEASEIVADLSFAIAESNMHIVQHVVIKNRTDDAMNFIAYLYREDQIGQLVYMTSKDFTMQKDEFYREMLIEKEKSK